MAWPVYTERFLLVSTPNVVVTYTVPAGKRAVIMTVAGMNGSTGAVDISLQLGSPNVWIKHIPAQTFDYATGLRLAVYAGEQLKGFCSASGATLWVTGYLFSNLTGLRDVPATTMEALEADDAPMAGETFGV